MAREISGIQRSQPTVTSAGKSFIGTVIARLPFSYQIIDKISEMNPKYEVFNKLVSDRESRVAAQSIYRQQKTDDSLFGSMISNKAYQKLMYANIELDKVKRLQDYRRMSTYAELVDAIEEMSDELIVEDEDGKIVKLEINKEEYSQIIIDEIKKEFEKFISYFEFDDKGWDYFRSLIIDGEYFFENVISEKHPEYGIIGVVSLPTELINPIYDNVQNDDIKGYLLRKPVINPKTQMIEKDTFAVLDKKQVTYIHSGVWNEDKTIRLPYIENARRAYKQLSLVEDSIIIHRLVRAPEKLVFKVDTGNLSPPKAEAYLKKMMQQIWAKKTYDVTTGRITNIYEPQSYLDAYWFAKRQGSEGTSVESLQSNAKFGEIDDLMYFLKKLYKSLKVPTNRLNPEDGVKDGLEMSREELRFAKFLIRIQKRFAKGLKDGFITHLKLRNIWQQYKLKERHIKLLFNTPTLYMVLKQQQIFDVKYNNFNNMSTNEGIANSFAQEMYLGLTADDMARNREWRRRDAAFQWEIEQIATNGPGWRAQAKAAESAAAEMESALGGGGGGGGPPAGGGESELPEFGPSPAGGGEVEGTEAPPEVAAGTAGATSAPAPEAAPAPNQEPPNA